ncbi:tRNA (N(6)-L-threonylcarbamoyladenosine(37)-C(2))-methylthiotransferase MtaB [Caproicibacterium lactatifermentans]|uniref:tRNA (N(6)-L-threonylcarbamoyladenosine(37)-C(2))-methylthiotransferase n=1 Tax=Caproicibacterium lactatifermentans TaxID=2666138 RepID=A0ABX6PTU4_9FIRM|nr:tRNA (N(6)-L-threonylcarbamoyladenosine(37)-C(2))-methylthiotransferase MtaB [Caproicibacterium lactatifermentans]MDD4807878.1 tRNA (N(6)-L-threonylcarbamoyladenosine(37)-C(2))-methylthiotransferase MtaB [Oscillospiraceae bacterium]QKO29645.1 tRNA (N(6)-L-threonylcarbamoyladenosine(37)-C(2))-methylthiotransferase MtaB [Caproicibacterium lactatifermentans]
MKVSAITLGCKVNQYETQAMLAQLAQAGFTICDGPADVILINSCTVTAQSDHKVRQALHRARRENPDAVLVLTGCMPQAFPERAASLADADIVLGNANRSGLTQHILNYLSTHQRIVDIEPHGKTFEKMQVTDFYERTRAFVKIEDGCNRFCTYCIIPYARGRVRSKPLEDLRSELAQLGKHGYREVVLTGINLPAYGQDLGLTLCDAVDAACAVPEIQRVRLGSLEPEQLSPEVIARLAAQEKLCPQFHLSLQSGCDATLRRMNRHYTADEYRTIVQNLRRVFPNAAITTDIMVGFAGETEEEFQQSLAFAREIAFAKVHVFPYSQRPGTRAADFPGQIQKSEKENRCHQMIAVTQETRRAFLQQQVGRTEPVLFERRRENDALEGYTPNYTSVLVSSAEELTGKILPVKVTEALEDSCRGTLTGQL